MYWTENERYPLVGFSGFSGSQLAKNPHFAH